MTKHALIETAAVVGALAAAAGAATGAVLVTTGDNAGAPGISRSLARLGGFAGGGMLAGVAVLAAGATLVSLAVYEGVRGLER